MALTWWLLLHVTSVQWLILKRKTHFSHLALNNLVTVVGWQNSFARTKRFTCIHINTETVWQVPSSNAHWWMLLLLIPSASLLSSPSQVSHGGAHAAAAASSSDKRFNLLFFGITECPKGTKLHKRLRLDHSSINYLCSHVCWLWSVHSFYQGLPTPWSIQASTL